LMGGPSAKVDGQFAALFAGVVLIAAGVNIFAIGALFNYIVSLFHKRQIRQGLFGRPIFKVPLERRFGWLGLIAMLAGGLIYAVAVWQHWTTPANAAPWFAPAVSTVMVLTGLQLLTSWLLVILLAELSEREVRAEVDFGETVPAAPEQEDVQSAEPVAPLAGLSTQ